MSNIHVIIGAGGLGRGVATELAGRGLETRLVSRSAALDLPSVTSVRADARDPESLAEAVRGAAVVYQCAQPSYTRWVQEFPQLQRGILDAAVRASADLVIADNLYAYGDPNGLPISEDSSEQATTRKGAVRRSMAQDALEAHREGRLRGPVAARRLLRPRSRSGECTRVRCRSSRKGHAVRWQARSAALIQLRPRRSTRHGDSRHKQHRVGPRMDPASAAGDHPG